MTKHEDILAELIEQLEQGTPVDQLLEKVDDDESELRAALQMAAVLWKVHPPMLSEAAERRIEARLDAVMQGTVAAPPAVPFMNHTGAYNHIGTFSTDHTADHTADHVSVLPAAHLPTHQKRQGGLWASLKRMRGAWVWPLPLRYAGAVTSLVLLLALGSVILASGQWSETLSHWQQGNTPTLSVIHGELHFEPNFHSLVGCQSHYHLSGQLVPPAGVQAAIPFELGYTLSKGAAYIESVQLTPALRATLHGEPVEITIDIALNIAWIDGTGDSATEAAGSATDDMPTESGAAGTTTAATGEDAVIQMVVFARTSTEDLAAADVVITIVRQCVQSASPLAPPTPANDPQAVETQATDPGPRTSLPLTVCVPDDAGTGDADGTPCLNYGVGERNLAVEIAEKAGVDMGEIYALRAAGLGWGQIMQHFGVLPRDEDEASEVGPPYGVGEVKLAEEIATESGAELADIFAMREAGLGWGQIMQHYGLLPREGPDDQ